MLKDLQYALRMMRNSPGFTAVALLSLALGTGANTTIFTVVNALILRYLPVQQPQQLVLVTRQQGGSLSNPVWEALQKQQDVFSSVFAWGRSRWEVPVGGTSQRVSGMVASGSYFTTLGVGARLGRVFTAADDHRGCDPIAVLSHDFWQHRFGGDPNIVGKTVPLNGHPFQIVGVTGPQFYGLEVGSSFDIAAPICSIAIASPEVKMLDNHRTWWLYVMGRMRPGMSERQVVAGLSVIAPKVYAAAIPDASASTNTLEMAPGGRGLSYVRKQYSKALLILMAIVGAVLLIACTNIANLLLARAAARQREIAVRLAIGASRARLIRQMLVESVLLSSMGALLGALFAGWAGPLLVRFISPTYRAVSLDLSPDWRVLAFTTGVALLGGVLFGLAPAFRGTAVESNEVLKAAGRTSSQGGSRFGIGKLLVVSQVAVSLVLLIGAALFVGTFRNLLTVDAGFRRDNVLVLSVDLEPHHFPAATRAAAFDQLAERLRAVPGVLDASESNAVPIGGGTITNSVYVPGQSPRSHDDSQAYYNQVSPHYFSALGTTLLAGRDFDARDRDGAPLVAVINESTARKFFPGGNPIGRFYYENDKPEGDRIEIVGMVKDAKYASLREEAPPTVYRPLAQSNWRSASLNFEVSGIGAPEKLIPALRKTVASISPDIRVDFQTFREQIGDSLIQERLLATLSGFFGGLAVLLAMVGLYGVMSYIVARRQGEIGIRMALGARPGSVLWLVLRDVALLVSVGIGVGLGVSLLVTRIAGKMLFGLTASDPATIAGSVLLLAVVAGLSGYLPARRAARVDPMVAMRDA